MNEAPNGPCLNPSCKSHGKPHPNCRCYSQMAEGGETSFCSKDRQHLQACEYYADGGEVPESDLPASEGQEVPQNDLPPSQGMAEVPESDLPDENPPQSKYGGIGQQVLAGVEGAGQGYLGPVATAAEKGLNAIGVPGVSNEDIKGRANANPGTHAIGEVAGTLTGALTGTGEIGVIAKVLPEFTALGKLGSTVIRGAIESGLLQTGDEISNAMIGNGDPQAPVSSALAHITGAALLGGGAGGLFHVTGQAGMKALQELENSKMGTRARNLLSGIGMASKMHEHGVPLEEAEGFVNDLNGAFKQEFFDKHGFKDLSAFTENPFLGQELKYKDIKPGIDLFNSTINTARKDTGKTIGEVGGYAAAGIPGAVAGRIAGDRLLKPLVEKIIDKSITSSNKYLLPTIVKSLSEGHLDNLLTHIDYASKVAKGANSINKAVDGLFQGGRHELFESLDKDDDKLDDLIKDGSLPNQIQTQFQEQPSQFAAGGEVNQQATNKAQDSFSQLYPEQSTLLSAAKARVYNYLNSVRPQPPASKLPYDKHSKDPIQERSYRSALKIANQPLSVLNDIKRGVLTLDNLKHMAQMYPELHDHLSKKINERIVQNQVHEEKPSYKVRQGLSLFLGAPLDTTMTPQSIMAAQSIYAPKQAPQDQTSGKAKKNTSPLSKVSGSYMTKDQAREQRENKQ